MENKLKEHLHREVKPDNKQQLMDRIYAFWRSVDVAKCTKYIHQVLPCVTEVNGAATGFLFTVTYTYTYLNRYNYLF